MKQNDTSAHWRDSALTPKFFWVDARAAFGILLVLFYPRWWTVGIAIVFLLFLAFLNYLGLSISVVGRIMRGWLSGPKKILVYKR
jgi:intracellular multiplication protein IcmT